MIQKDKVRVDIFGERFRTRAGQLTHRLELSPATLMSIVKWYSSKRRWKLRPR